MFSFCLDIYCPLSICFIELRPQSVNLSTPGSNFGTGGMQTKLIAAELATAAGVSTVILNSDTPTNILKIVDYGLPSSTSSSNASSSSSSDLFSSSTSPSERSKSLPPHTIFLPFTSPLTSKKWTILHALHPAGILLIDQGAWKRISRSDSGGRLLPVGVKGVVGNWERMQSVRLVVRKRKKQSPKKIDERNKIGSEEVKAIQNENPNALDGISKAGEEMEKPSTGSEVVNNDQNQSVGIKDWEKKLETYLHSSVASISSLGLMSSSGHTTPKDNQKASNSGNTSLSNSLIDESSSSSQIQPIEPEQALNKTNDSSRMDHQEAGPSSELSKEEEEDDFLWELVEIGRALANYTSIECERIRGINR